MWSSVGNMPEGTFFCFSRKRNTCRRVDLFFALRWYFYETGHLQTCKPFFCTSPIDITEVNFSDRLLRVIEDQSHQKWVIKKNKEGWKPLAYQAVKRIRHQEFIIQVRYRQSAADTGCGWLIRNAGSVCRPKIFSPITQNIGRQL